MKKVDKSTGIYIADSADDPLSSIAPTFQEVIDMLSGYILSASGWRAVLAESKKEEDSTEFVTPSDKIIAALAANAFFDFLSMENPKIIVGSDTRPTGRVLLWIVARILRARGADVRYLGVSSAPEIMAFSHTADGFFYISASHNPIGHNGYKFGRKGGVLSNDECTEVKRIFHASLKEGCVEEMKKLSSSLTENDAKSLLNTHERVKSASLKYYRSFVAKTEKLKKGFEIPFGIVIDFNGSARSASIDIPFLRSLGARVWTANSVPGQIAHAIVPEGENLETVRLELEKAHKIDSRFLIGYMPDNDGDRGNFVYLSDDGNVKALQAQEVFALVASIELADIAMKRNGRKIGIAVNGPTSLLIDDIARCLHVSVYRSDIGEANVVTLSDKLRAEGIEVPICGEGSNGGNITYPARVRDPLNSVMTIAKLWSVDGLYLYLRAALHGINVDDSNAFCEFKRAHINDEVSLDGLLNAFPSYAMTAAFSKDAVLKIKSKDFDALKTEYEKILLCEVEENLPENAVRYEIRQYEGSDECVGFGAAYRPYPSTGGYKVQFIDLNDNPIGYLWLSRSRTEPVCRVMVNIKGTDATEHDRLLKWQRSMVERADRLLS